MTKENCKRLYAHYLSVGRLDAANDLLKYYPDLETPVKEPEPEQAKEEVKEVKKDGKKSKG